MDKFNWFVVEIHGEDLFDYRHVPSGASVAHVVAAGTEWYVAMFPSGDYRRRTSLPFVESLDEAKSIVETLAPIYWSA